MAEVQRLAEIGVVGLAVMGSNLAKNIESRGYPVAVYNRTTDVTAHFMEGVVGRAFVAAKTPEELVQSIAQPRKIIIMVKAGAPTDAVIDALLPLLAPDDMIIDGGNAYYKDTQRREKKCKEMKIHFLGVGISGGEEGALKGPSLMPGGPRDGWKLIAPVLEKIAAKVGGEACTGYIGADGSGHFVKMVHNGIEYGDMQLIAEAYSLLKGVVQVTPPELSKIFEQWNKGELLSFLIEITSKIFTKHDSDGKSYLVDKILDKAGQKGTGKWTVIEALELGVAIPTIAAAVDARVLSSMKEERCKAAPLFTDATVGVSSGEKVEKAQFIQDVHDALYASKIIAYAQGMALLKSASKAYNWDLQLGEIAAMWRGGCIIRASFLEDIRKAYAKDSALSNLLLDPQIMTEVSRAAKGLRRVSALAAARGIPIPAFAASLSYFDSYRSANLPQNLTQAQRDFFGAHTYERSDKPGVFHTQWE